MLEKESKVREELLDWFMHKKTTEDLKKKDDKSLQEKSEYYLKPEHRTS